MNNLQNTRKAIRQALDVIGACPNCNQTRFIMATSWRGHGTGQHGSAHYSATGFEKVHPETHCICTGGPVWEQIADKPFGIETKMRAGFSVWEKLPTDTRHNCVVVWSPKGAWATMTLEKWRKMLIENWDALNQ